LTKLIAIALIVILCISSVPMSSQAIMAKEEVVIAEKKGLFGGILKVGLFADVATFMLGAHTHAESHMVGNKIWKLW